MFEDAQQLLEKLLNIVTVTTNLTIVNLKIVLSGIQDFAKNVILDTNGKLTTVVFVYTEKINTLIDQATSQGFDVKNCVGDNLIKMQAIPAETVETVTECVNPKLDNATNVVNNGIQGVQNLGSIVTNLTEALNNCESTSALCIGKVTANATYQIAQVPIKAAGIVSNVTALTGTISKDMASCATTKGAGDAIQDITTIGNEVESCIKNLMNNA